MKGFFKKYSILILVLAYLIWPLDLIPELFLGPIGTIDDVAILLFGFLKQFVFNKPKEDKRQIIDGEEAPD